MCVLFFFFQAVDGIRDLVRSRGLGDVYKEQGPGNASSSPSFISETSSLAAPEKGRCAPWLHNPVCRSDTRQPIPPSFAGRAPTLGTCPLYTSDAADEEDGVNVGVEC